MTVAGIAGIGVRLLVALATLCASLTPSQGSDMKSVAEFVAEAQALAERDGSGRIDISELARTAFKVGGDIATYEAELRKQGFTGGLADTPLEGKLLAMRKIGSWGLGFFRFINLSQRRISIGLYTNDGLTVSKASAYIFTDSL